MSSSVYDLVVIGGGSAGLTAAKFAATFQKSVVIVEKNKLGGDCTWSGCVPSKSLLASSKAAHVVRTASEYGVSTDSNPRVDMKAIRDRIGANMERIYQEDDSPEAMAKLGIDTILGKAVFKSPSVLQVSTSDTETLTVVAKQGIVVATGAQPRRPSTIKGLEDVDYFTYEEIFDLESLPQKLTVVGGGPIGCELAQAFCRLGSQVTQVASTLLPKAEPEVHEALEDVFISEGIMLVKGRLTSVIPASSGGHEATCSLMDGTTCQVSGDVLLVAVGRAPNVNDFGLQQIGVEFNEKGGIKTNQKLKTSVNHVYSAGDCTGERQFTHYAGFQGAIAARNILLPLSDAGVVKNVPSATFTSLEVSSIGLTEAVAKDKHGADNVGVAFKLMNTVDRSICDGEESGFIKIVYSRKTYRILGATVMSPAGGELISEIAVAMKAKLTFDQLATVIHSYPAYSIALQMMASEVSYERTLKLKPFLDFLKKIGL